MIWALTKPEPNCHRCRYNGTKFHQFFAFNCGIPLWLVYGMLFLTIVVAALPALVFFNIVDDQAGRIKDDWPSAIRFMRALKTIFKKTLVVALVTCLLSAITSCHKTRSVQTSFYYWKTVYEHNPVEQKYFNALHCRKLYLRIMDVDAGDNGITPVSPVSFKNAIADSVQLVPVVFIVNQVLITQTHQQLNDLAGKIAYFVTGKVRQSGKRSFGELQIDCDWTRSTRENYFYLLNRIRSHPDLKNKTVSATLRLHQLKNQQSSGIPPVNRVMLMCYNMGNLRKYGRQNSILEQAELEKYVGDNLANYPMPVDIGLPIFSWAVVFRQKQYAGIAKRLNLFALHDRKIFEETAPNFYTLKVDMPAYGLKSGDEIRWEAVPPNQLAAAAEYLQKFVSSNIINIIYFHLDEQTLSQYPLESLEKTAALFR